MTAPAFPLQAAPQTLAQKLIARACGREAVAVGEIVTCAVDLAMFHDSSGPRRLQPMLEELGAQLWDRSKIVLVMDHYVPERDDPISTQISVVTQAIQKVRQKISTK